MVLVLGAIATASYISVFKGFAFLNIINQYKATTSTEEKSLIENQAAFIISIGRSHSPGTFLSFFTAELAGLFTGIVMLKGKIFTKVNAWLAISGFSMMLVYEITSSFIPQASVLALGLATIGGLLVLGYQILIAKNLLKLAR